MVISDPRHTEFNMYIYIYTEKVYIFIYVVGRKFS